MGVIKDNPNVEKTYNITPEQVKELVAKDLGVPVEEVKIDFVIREVGGDFMDRYPGTPTVTEIKVIHKPK